MTSTDPTDEAATDPTNAPSAELAGDVVHTDDASAPPAPGAALLKASWGGTVVFVVTAGVAAAVPDAGVPALVVALVLFVGGTGAFAAALLRAAGRSRREELTMGGLFLLEGAPKAIRRQFFAALVIEVVAAFVTAGLRPNSSLAFGILAPVWGEGVAALWAARHGTFPARRPPSRPAARATAASSAAGGEVDTATAGPEPPDGSAPS